MPLVRPPFRGARVEPRHARGVPAVHLRRGLEAALDVLGDAPSGRPACALPWAVRGGGGGCCGGGCGCRTEHGVLDRPTSAVEWAGCAMCALAASRTLVVAGEGPMPAELMLVADAPGFHDDRLGRPLVGARRGAARRSARLDRSRAPRRVRDDTRQVPPAGDAEPGAEEIAACRDKLERQVELVRPRVVAALGDLATRTLAGGPHGVSQTHGQVRRAELAGREITLLPLYHPLRHCTTPGCCRRSRPMSAPRRAARPRRPWRLRAGRRAEPSAEPVANDEQQLGLF